MRVLNQKVLLLFLSALYFTVFACAGGSGKNQSGDELTPVYDVSLSKSISVPASNPVGLAFDDDENAWIMSGVYNGDIHTLICIDPNSGDILQEFQYIGLIETLGTGVFGIAWDGSSIWISVSGNVNKIVKVDPITGDILNILSSPSVLGPSDLSWDGTNLWISTGTGEIHTINPANGSRLKFLDLPGLERDSGVAFKDGEIWIGNLFNNSLTIYDVSSKEVVDSIEGALIDNGMFAFFHDQLVVLSGAGIDFYDIQIIDMK